MNKQVNRSPEAANGLISAAAGIGADNPTAGCRDADTPTDLLCSSGDMCTGIELQQAVQSVPASYWFTRLVDPGTAADDYEAAVCSFLGGTARHVLA